MAKKEEKVIQETAEKLFNMLDIAVSVAVEMGEETAQVALSSDETGMLIGYHGETLEALQLVLSLCVAKALGKFVRISVEIGDYKKNREEYLASIVMQAKERVLSDNTPVSLPNLKSWERRIVHLLLQNDEEVISESEGEGRDRTLVIRQKSK